VNGKAHSTALWASLTALFTNLAAVNVIALVGGDDASPGWQAAAAVITSLFVAASVYAKLRWDATKQAQSNGGGTAPPTPTQRKRVPK
jgi:hypothetical protein